MTAACSVQSEDAGRPRGLSSSNGSLVSAGLKIMPDVTPLVLPTIVGGTRQSNVSYLTITEMSGVSGTGALVVARESGDAEIVSGAEGCAGTVLTAGGSCQNAYALDCTAAAPGAKTASFTVTDPASLAVAQYDVTGTCDPVPTGTAFITQVAAFNDYGAVYLGMQAASMADFTVTNSGDGNTGALVTPIQSDKIGDAYFRFTGDCSTTVSVLAPGDNCSMAHNLDCRSPATPGPQSVKVLEFDPVSGTSVTVTLTGTCACRPTAETCSSGATCCSGVCTANQCE